MSGGLSRNSLLSSAAGVLASLAVALPRVALAQSGQRLTVGVLPPADISGEPYYAESQGFFRAQGLDVSIQPLANGSATIAAVAGGTLDIAYSNMLSMAIAHGRGIDMLILAPANLHVREAPTTGILAVNRSSAIFSAKDLTGKLVAVEGLNNVAEISARSWIDKNGGDSQTVKFVELAGATMPAAILANRVDAAVMNAIYDTTFGKRDDPLRRLCSSTFDAISTRWAPSVWFTSPQWIAQHPSAALAFVRAMRTTADWANKNQSATAEVLARYTQQTVSDIQSTRRVTYGGAMTPELIQPGIDAAAHYGLIKTSFPASDMIANLGDLHR
jgi:NitT/TauT family transport system substrate-binding protein